MTGRLSLSFDNGPTPGITERILEVLARHGLRVTFFVIGQKLRDKAAAGLLAEMAAAGHWIGNHTLTHSVALGDRPDAAYARTEIEEAQALVGTWPGHEKLFRPYGGSFANGRGVSLRKAGRGGFLRQPEGAVSWPSSAGRSPWSR